MKIPDFSKPSEDCRLTVDKNGTILNVGDASFTLHGGHTYEILQYNTIVYE